MSEQSSIYDLGYRPYEGERIGRKGTLLTLYVHGLRSCFGLGRRATSKLFPFGLAIVAYVPALVQLAIAATLSGADEHVDIFKHEDYLGFTRLILILFCAAVAPELVGRDQRNRTLSLYFSRAVTRRDYAFAKLAALTTAMLALTLGPQLLLYVGNGLATNDIRGYIADNADLLPPILAASVLVSLAIAAVGLVVASYLPRRAYATGAIVGATILTSAIVGIVVATTQTAPARAAVLFGPQAWEGLTLWLFGAEPASGSAIAEASLSGWLYLLAVVSTVVLAVAATLRRFVKVTT
ncbi:MAG: hypothetical protein U0R50_13895 [Gaiellales bacterium]